MSCRLQSRITAILLLAATLPLFLTTYGSVFDPNQSLPVRRNLPNGSKARGEDVINLERSEQRLNTATKNSKGSFLPSSNIYMLPPFQTDAEQLFQSDSQGFPDQSIQGNVHFSSSHITPEWLQMRPLVQCSSAAIIFTAKGLNYVHLLVNREGASPVSILHLPSNCGYNVKATWRELVLVVPYNGCYVLQQNGSYVLPLLWWGMSLNISCPMPPASAPAMPSGFCSYLGITLGTEGSWRDIEKYRIKVNEEWVPLISNTCACRMDSAPEDLILFIPFTVKCVKDGGTTLKLLLDGKMYTVSCQPHHYIPHYPQYNPSAPFPHPLHPLKTQYIPLNPSVTKPHLPEMNTNVQPMAHRIMLPAEQASPVDGTGVNAQASLHTSLSYDISHVPVTHSSEMPTTGGAEKTLPPFVHLQVPQVPQHPQVPQNPQQHMFPVLTNDSSQLSPVLTCKKDLLRASLHSAKMKSVKIKDMKRKVWVPVSSAPVHCGYSLQRKGRGVVFSSPLPACHSYTVRPSLLSLSLKFWDPVIQRHHAVQLQCPYTSPSPTITASSPTTTSLMLKPVFTRPQPASHEIQLSHPEKPLGSYSNPSKPRDPSIRFPNPTDQFLYPPKPTPPSFQQSNNPMPTFWPPKLTGMSQTTPLASQVHQPQVLCHFKDMSVTLPSGPVTELMVQSPIGGINENIKAVLFDEAPSHCGYLMKKNQNGGINILLPYTSCHMVYQAGQYRIVLKYQTADGRKVEAFLSCQVPMNHECSLPFEHRLACGPSSVSAAECRELGCCYSTDTQTCYYSMDECTADRHFVFSIPASLTEPPLSPALLVAAGNSSCTPQRVVDDLALFKIPLDGCGTHKYEVGNTVIYMLEILNTLHSVTLNYGTITRDSPFRLLVECRYLPGTVASVGYLVKSPSLGPSIQAHGVFGVQLRIAKGQYKQYSSYYPQYHRPLHKLLGKPLYLEVRLLNPLDPSAVLLVQYCVAYPRSAHSTWVLIYDGCPNPLDVTPSHEPPPTPSEGLANHVRRFTVSTFQFLEKNRKEATSGEQVVKEEGEGGEEEEIYFMCATEVCLPSEGPCVEGCIDREYLTFPLLVTPVLF
ncbi:zona pellucida sperm-binding protein 4-like isoform X2 [Silurus meridionalis]|nr:zona pellucida sperm-binding protein 4-like isoform X2 [Silurus meridionalis]